MNPHHTVPTLNDNGNYLWDSHAICTYLIDKYAKNDRLYSKDTFTRARINQLLHYNSKRLTNLWDITIFPVMYQGAADICPINRSKIFRCYQSMESLFDLNHEYLVENHMTIADISCGNTFVRFDIIEPIDGEKFPKLRHWLNELLLNDNFRQLNFVGWTNLKKCLPEKYHRFNEIIY